MPRLTSLSGAQAAVFFDDPLGIVEFDEVADGIPQLRDVAVDATMDDLFLQRAIEPLGKAWPGENVDEPNSPSFTTDPSTATFFSKLSVMFRSSLDTLIKPILCLRKSGPTHFVMILEFARLLRNAARPCGRVA